VIWDECAYVMQYKCTHASQTPRVLQLLGDEAQVEAQFSQFGDSANLDAR
jgi:hypothetical protein